jgi:class 3 adenylate cyclase
LGNLIHARPMGELKVKGRKTPSTAYQLIDLKARE